MEALESQRVPFAEFIEVRTPSTPGIRGERHRFGVLLSKVLAFKAKMSRMSEGFGAEG